MNRNIFRLLIIILVTCILIPKGQSTDTRNNKSSFKSDTARINELNSRALKYQRMLPDSAFFLANKALILSKKINYEKGIADAFYGLGILHLVNFGKYDSTSYYLNGALKLYEKEENLSGIGRTYYGMAYFYSFQGNLEESEKQLQKALKYFTRDDNKSGLYNTYNSLSYIAKQYKQYQEAYDYQIKSIDIITELNDTSALSDAQNNLGNLFKDQGMLKHAIDAYFKSLNLAESIHDTNGLSIAYGSIGNLYFLQKDYSNALKYLKMKLSISLSTNSYWETSKTYNSIAMVYNDLMKPDSAIFYLQQSLALNQKMHYSTGIANVYEKLADTYLTNQMLDSASHYIKLAIALGEKSNTKANLAEYHVLFGEILKNKGKDKHALKEITTGYNLAHELNMPLVRQKASLLLSELYKSENDYDKAYQLLSEYIILKDSLTNADHLKNITRLEMEYEFDKKERQILYEKEQEKMEFESKMRQQRYFFMSAVGFLLLVTLLGILFFRQKSLQMKFHTIDLEQKLLRTQMSPHFIFNSLCSIQDYVLRKDIEEANNFLTRFAMFMRFTLENSRKDYISMENELNTLKNYLEVQKLRFEKEFSYTITIDDRIDIETYCIPPMMAQPFIENAIEHGLLPKEEKGTINIKYTLNNDLIQFEIIDNGVGRNSGLKISSKQKNYDKSSLATILTLERLKYSKNINSKKVKLDIIDLVENNKPAGTKVVFNMPYQITLN